MIIPAANIPNLMLKDEVVEAVRAGQFHVWAVRTIEEGIALLTDCPAGECGPDGTYPPESVHRRVQDQLRHYADQLRAFAVGPGDQKDTPH